MSSERSMVEAALVAIRGRVSVPDPSSDDEPVLYECRHCGTGFGEEPGGCTDCGASAIAAYRASTLR